MRYVHFGLHISNYTIYLHIITKDAPLSSACISMIRHACTQGNHALVRLTTLGVVRCDQAQFFKSSREPSCSVSYHLSNFNLAKDLARIELQYNPNYDLNSRCPKTRFNFLRQVHFTENHKVESRNVEIVTSKVVSSKIITSKIGTSKRS